MKSLTTILSLLLLVIFLTGCSSSPMDSPVRPDDTIILEKEQDQKPKYFEE